ncbi:hypothetical protein BD410DRAFT_1916 [Rickenella mellea]|uniref:Uncharacterized protein n=1 Tax=Rickenella mellea TaxID=50990 RepID=A0A4R5XDI6_9AGAM|nr:hypothetical protein BD410DRAFT_1916 [Rickenella mellea]
MHKRAKMINNLSITSCQQADRKRFLTDLIASWVFSWSITQSNTNNLCASVRRSSSSILSISPAVRGNDLICLILLDRFHSITTRLPLKLSNARFLSCRQAQSSHQRGGGDQILSSFDAFATQPLTPSRHEVLPSSYSGLKLSQLTLWTMALHTRRHFDPV